jgi:hypothetical protein
MLLLPVMLQTGAGLTVSVRLQLETQPAAFVTITVYVPANVRLLMVAPVAVNPEGPVQL